MRHAAYIHRALVIAIAALGLALPASSAQAQSRRRPPTKQTPPPTQPGQTQPQTQPGRNQPPAQPGQTQPQTQPGQPGQPGATPAADPWADLKPSPHITRYGRPKRWTITAFHTIGSYQDVRQERNGPRLEYEVWEFDAATLVYPLLGETGSSILEVWGPPDNEVPAVRGKAELNDREVSDEMSVLTQGFGGGPLPCGTWRAQWQIPDNPGGRYTARELDFEVSISQACFETRLDERGAGQIDWPKGPWPPDAAATFQPQMFVDFDAQGRGYDMGAVVGLLDTWAEGRSVEDMRKQSKPLMLAKWLAGQAVQHVQINGEGLTFDETGLWEGFDTPGAAAAAAEGRGTELDLPCLLVALYRAVGLPARLVIGYDKQGDGESLYVVSKKGSGTFRVWVEFALYDEANKTFGWVPVDVSELRRSQSRMPPNYLNRPLRYFGTHPDLDEIVPLAFHFHPPTTVRSYGAPALWGWFVTPTPPARATQQVRFNMGTTPSGGSNESHLPAEKQK